LEDPSFGEKLRGKGGSGSKGEKTEEFTRLGLSGSREAKA